MHCSYYKFNFAFYFNGWSNFQDYRLDFNHFSKRWHGAAATIVEDPGNCVYGVLWEIANEDMANLDR